MIRQAISCDICGAEKKQTNHWFVASEQAGELRVTGWSSRNRLRAGSKHLCGQTCLHKLLDEFLARAVAGRPAPEAANCSEAAEDAQVPVSRTALVEEESSARIIPAIAAREPVAAPAVLAMPARALQTPQPMVMPRRQETAAEAARRRRAEAWERERARELRVVDARPN